MQLRKPQLHKHQAPRHHWKKGSRLSDYKRRPAVRDYGRYGLRKPTRGQQWVRVNNDFLLISLTTGVITVVIAGR